MVSNNLDFLTRHAHYQDLLREAEQERLIRTAAPRASSIKWVGLRHTVNWLGTYLTRFGLQLQAGRSGGPTCCAECCPVALNTPTHGKIIFK
jgi:hypothetical protein